MSGVNAIKFATDCRILKDMDRCPTAAMARVTGCGFPSTRAAVQPISAAHPSPPAYPVTVCKELTSVFATAEGSDQNPEEISARGMAPAVETARPMAAVRARSRRCFPGWAGPPTSRS